MPRMPCASALRQGGFSVSLIDGVTGSGKTEVYFEAVAEALRQRRQALILLPEIALTNQFLQRFEARFGCRPLEWHSAISPGERSRIWRGVAEGEIAKVVAGARSALFLPFADLGLIVVDEEHDTAFKQEDRVNYQGRDMAVVRASLDGRLGRAEFGDALAGEHRQCPAGPLCAISSCRSASQAR